MRFSHPVVIAAFRSSGDAGHARAMLEHERIAAEVIPRQDGIERLCEDAFDGGFDVIVESNDAGAAISFIQRHWPDETPIDAQVLDRCPSCGSTDVARIRRLRLFAIAAAALLAGNFAFGQRDLFLLVIAITGGALLLAPATRCRACGERWS